MAYSGEVHAAAATLDEEQHVQPLQPDRLDREEVDREQAVPMRPNELAPRHRPVAPPTAGRVIAIPQVGGLHHRYERRAA